MFVTTFSFSEKRASLIFSLCHASTPRNAPKEGEGSQMQLIVQILWYWSCRGQYQLRWLYGSMWMHCLSCFSDTCEEIKMGGEDENRKVSFRFWHVSWRICVLDALCLFQFSPHIGICFIVHHAEIVQLVGESGVFIFLKIPLAIWSWFHARDNVIILFPSRKPGPRKWRFTSHRVPLPPYLNVYVSLPSGLYVKINVSVIIQNGL